LASGSLLLIEYAGKKSGRRHALPVQYLECGGEILVLVGWPERKRWWRNLRPEAPVRVLHRGRWVEACAHVVEGDAGEAAPRLERFFERYPSAAQYNGIGRDEPGKLDPAALLEFAGRAVIVVIRRCPSE
jgi:deazaflavin-dependent oxidoreductase (nitroreductase family)